MQTCTCTPGDLCAQHEAERRAYLRRKKAPGVSEERARHLAKRKANPQPCSDCAQVKPLHIVGERICGACYMRRRRPVTASPIQA